MDYVWKLILISTPPCVGLGGATLLVTCVVLVTVDLTGGISNMLERKDVLRESRTSDSMKTEHDDLFLFLE